HSDQRGGSALLRVEPDQNAKSIRAISNHDSLGEAPPLTGTPGSIARRFDSHGRNGLLAEFDSRSGRFSPDGRWIAYQSNESGKDEICVRPFPAPAGGGGKWLVSQGDGVAPGWRRDGKELFYLRPGGKVMVWR